MMQTDNLQEYRALFSADEEKAKAFDRIAEQFYARNFGRMTKSDFEALLFDIYLEACLQKQKRFDDYTLSRELGITQSRVRNLKVRKELLYPHEGFDWKQSFVDCIKDARFDDVKRLVKLHISDVNVLIELRNYLEEHGWYDEYQLNPKLFQCPLTVFVELCASLDTVEEELPQEVRAAFQSKMEELQSEAEKNALELLIKGDREEKMRGLRKLASIASNDLLAIVLENLPVGKGLAQEAGNYLADVIRG